MAGPINSPRFGAAIVLELRVDPPGETKIACGAMDARRRRIRLIAETSILKDSTAVTLSKWMIATLLCMSPLAETPLAPADAEPATTFSPAEKQRLERAARYYRISAYDQYRSQRAEYERRQAAWNQIEQAWQDAGARPDDLTLLVDWARRATLANRRGFRLPATPDFSRGNELPAIDLNEAPLTPPVVIPPPPDAPRQPGNRDIVDRQQSHEPLPEIQTPINSPQVATRERSATIDRPSEFDDEPPIRRDAAPAIAAPPASRSTPMADVNVEELIRRIRGFNLSVAVAHEAAQTTDRWTVDSLNTHAKRLSSLSISREDLSLYYKLVGATDRASLDDLAELNRTATLLLDQAKRLRRGLRAGSHQLAELSALIEKLEKLSRSGA